MYPWAKQKWFYNFKSFTVLVYYTRKKFYKHPRKNKQTCVDSCWHYPMHEPLYWNRMMKYWFQVLLIDCRQYLVRSISALFSKRMKNYNCCLYQELTLRHFSYRVFGVSLLWSNFLSLTIDEPVIYYTLVFKNNYTVSGVLAK